MTIHMLSLESLTFPPKLKSTSLVTKQFNGVILSFYFMLLLPNYKPYFQLVLNYPKIIKKIDYWHYFLHLNQYQIPKQNKSFNRKNHSQCKPFDYLTWVIFITIGM